MDQTRTHQSGSKAGSLSLWVLVAALGGLVLPGILQGAIEQGQAVPDPPRETVVALKEIPVWEVTNQRVRESFLRGQYAPVQKGRPQPMVKYPQFTSDSPLYGFVDFPNAVPDARQSRRIYYLAIDSSRKGGDYDLLYFDDNRDEDLTNDKLRHVFQESDKLARRSPSLQEIFFEPVQVTFNPGPEGRQTLEAIPCLRVFNGSDCQLTFCAVHVHTGTFDVGGVSYEAFLGHQSGVGSRLDQPSATLLLALPNGEPITWSGGEQLSTTHLLSGRYYRFAGTPAGDKLIVQPYTGPLGTFEVGPGARKVNTLTMIGALRSATTAVAVGPGSSRSPDSGPIRSCKLPVGDYRINDLFVQIDGLSALVLNNYHEDGQPMGRMKRQNTYNITIREDKPFVLEFSRQAEILFASPARDYRVKLGEELSIKAVLTDPALGVMFRVLTHEQQLDPKVTIARGNGEIVAEGTMPFG
jgi:hypothetical protein